MEENAGRSGGENRKPLKNNGESGIINTEEMLRRKGSAHRRIGSNGQQIIDVPTYNKLTKEFRKNGGVIIRGEEAETYLKTVKHTLHILYHLTML